MRRTRVLTQQSFAAKLSRSRHTRAVPRDSACAVSLVPSPCGPPWPSECRRRRQEARRRMGTPWLQLAGAGRPPSAARSPHPREARGADGPRLEPPLRRRRQRRRWLCRRQYSLWAKPLDQDPRRHAATARLSRWRSAAGAPSLAPDTRAPVSQAAGACVGPLACWCHSAGRHPPHPTRQCDRVLHDHAAHVARRLAGGLHRDDA